MTLVRIFIDTQALTDNQNKGTNTAPICIYNTETDFYDRANSVKIKGEAEICYEMWPDHNQARVWVEADIDSLEYEATSTELYPRIANK